MKTDHLAWYAEKFPAEATQASRVLTAGLKVRGAVPLALFGAGSGYGDGNGDGSGRHYQRSVARLGLAIKSQKSSPDT